MLKKYTHTKTKNGLTCAKGEAHTQKQKNGLTCARGEAHTEKQTHLHLDAHPHKLYTSSSVSHQVINISIFLSSFCQQPAGLGNATTWKKKTSLPSILKVKKRKSNCVKTENLTTQCTQGEKRRNILKSVFDCVCLSQKEPDNHP